MKNWFWDPRYTSDPLAETDFIVQKYQSLIRQDNVLVVNVAPNPDGRQEEADIGRLPDAAQILQIRREIAE